MQNRICEYLERHKTTVENAKLAEEKMIATKSSYLIVGEELSSSSNTSSARYYKIYFREIRMDELFFQLTPACCFRSGYLKIDRDGSISLTDNNFKPYRSSLNFYFDQGILKIHEDSEVADEEKLSSKCVKGLLSVGIFAAVAGALYVAAQESSTNELTF